MPLTIELTITATNSASTEAATLTFTPIVDPNANNVTLTVSDNTDYVDVPQYIISVEDIKELARKLDLQLR